MVLTLSEFADGETEETLRTTGMFQDAFANMQHIRRQGKLCDVTLAIVGGARFSAHRIVLAATIPYFSSMLTLGMSEENQKTITINGVEEHALEALINFAYTGVLTVDINTVESVLYGANYFQMDTVKQFCCDFIRKHLNPCNVLGVHNYAQMLMCFTLVERTNSFLHKHFIDVAKSDEFLDLGKDAVIELLSCSELNVANEEEVFRATSNWVMHDFKMRSQYMHELLREIRLPLLKPQFLTDVVQTDPACKACLKCRDLVDQAKDFHLIPDRRSDFPADQVTPRYCSEILGVIYAVGGLSSACDALNTVERFSPLLERWEQVAPMHSCRSRVGVAVLNGQLYAAGGYDGNERQNTVEVYSPDNNQWNYVTAMGAKRSALGCCAFDDKVYVCGGYDGKVSLSSCEMFEPHTLEWKPIQNMNKARSAVAVTCYEGNVWVLGGHDGLTIFNSVEFYDPTVDRWSMTTPMLSKRCRHGAASLRGKLFVFGGYDGREFLNSCEQFDRTTAQFTFIRPMLMRRSRVGVAISGRKIYCLGGYDGSLNLKCVEVYDSEKGEWAKGPDMLVHDGGVGVSAIIPLDY